jgi:tetratricopeptide (TPR) repeat protein
MRSELRGLAQFSWQDWNQAANYWLDHGGSLDEALKFSDRSLQMNAAFQNLMVRAKLLSKKGDQKGATEMRAKALTMGNEVDLNAYGYLLLQQKKFEDAISIFQKNVQAHPESWNVHDSLAEAYMIKGDKKAAVENYERALQMVKDSVQRKRIERTLTQLKAG